MSYLKNYLTKTKKEEKSAIAFLASIDHISETSKEIADAIIQELKDQRSYLKLIASENFSSLAVQLAMGNLLTDKYSEGVPKKRFYAGCDNVDKIETMAVEELKDIFSCHHAYVQPHSGADANLVAYWAILVHKLQDKKILSFGKKKLEELTEEEYEEVRQILINQKILGMSLSSGGHLTHGYRHNISSKMMRSYSYASDPNTGLIDYKKIREQAKKEKPLIIVGGYSSYPRLVNFRKLKEIADEAGSVLMVDMAHFAGLVAGKAIKGEYNPVGYADVITSTTHKTMRGPRGGFILCTEEFKEVIDKGCPLVLGGPMPHVMAAKALAFKEANTKDFCNYAESIIENSKALAEEFLKLGVELITGGTDNHMMVIDVDKSFGINGRQAESVLRKAHITVNRNSIPKDKNGPWYTSGIRVGTPAITTLGMKKDEMKEIAKVIYDVLSSSEPVYEGGKIVKKEVQIEEDVLSRSKYIIKNLLGKFLLYPELIID
ncbi:MAG: glycine hydroxymethyltransferase [Candidatus Thorarchaeota archaeon]